MIVGGTGEMAYWLRAHAALPEDPYLYPSGNAQCLYSSSQEYHPLLAFQGITSLGSIHMRADKTGKNKVSHINF